MTSRVASLARDVREMLHEQVEYRDLLVQMTKRDLLLRYKQTVMGVAWAVFTPLLNTIIFSIIFTRVAPIQTSVPYPLFAYCSFWAWNFTASSLKFAVNSLTSNTNLVTKVYFPREVFPIAAVLVALVDFAVASVVLIGMMAYYHVGVGPAALLFPVILGIQIVFTMALALWLAMWNLFYRDVKYLFEVVIAVWMFGSAVMYPVEAIGGRLGWFMQLNPMTPIIEAYRAVLLSGELPTAAPLLVTAALSIVALAVSWISFHRSEFTFAENV